MKTKWENVNFLSGDINWIESEPQEDMLQVKYPNNYILDMGWYTDRFIIYIVKDYMWSVTIVKYITKDKDSLFYLLKQAVERIEYESNKSKPYYGPLWKTEIINL